MEWLSGSQYHFRHGPQSHSILTTRGVRQGCVLSPLIWACLTCYILRRLPPGVDEQDVQAYADDFILSRSFSTLEGFHASIRAIPAFLQHLRDYGLKINTSKTVLLLRMATAKGKAASHKYLTHTKRGTFFRVPGVQPEFLPVRPKHVYLGCVISLFDFEADTLRHRIQVARTQFQRLKPALRSNRFLSLQKRTRLWSTCVWSTISYGLTCCGLPSASLRQFQRVINLQLRSISRLPSHVTRVTTEELYDKLQVCRPEEHLLRLSNQLCDRLRAVQAARPVQDVMCRPQLLHQAVYARDLTQESAGHHQRLKRVSQDESSPCPHCGMYFQGVTAVKIHIRRMHPEVCHPAVGTVSKDTINRYDLGVDGMPTCRKCGHIFGAWKDLVNHVTRNQCHGTSATEVKTSEPLPLSQQHDVVQKWINEGAARLCQSMDAHVRSELLQRCCLCRQWIASPSRIKAHIRRSHPDVFQRHFDDIIAHCGLLSSLLCDPCPFCLQPVAAKHRDRHATRCPVLLQVALCCRQHGPDDAGRNRLSLRGLASSLPSPTGAGPCAGHAATRECGGRNNRQPGGGPQAASEMAQAQWEGRPAPAVVVRQPRRSVLDWMARQQRPAAATARPARSAADAHATDAPSGGRHQCSSDGPRLSRLVQDPGPRNRSPHALRGGPGLASEEERPAGGPPAPDRPPEELAAGVEGPAGARHHHQRTAGASRQDGLGQAQRGQTPILVALGIQPGNQSRNPSPGPGAHGASGRSEGCGGPPAVPHRQHHAEVPQHAPFGGSVHGGDACLHAGDLVPGTGSPAGPRGPCLHVPPVGVVPDRGQIADGEPQAFSLGNTATEAAIEAVKGLAFVNTHNYCYQHVAVLTWVWTVLHAHRLQGLGDIHADLAGRGHVLIRQLVQQRPSRLHHAMAWATFTQTWARPRAQHDVGEFLTFLLPLLKPPCMQGSWQARVQDPAIRIYDSGTLTSPVCLAFTAGATWIGSCSLSPPVASRKVSTCSRTACTETSD